MLMLVLYLTVKEVAMHVTLTGWYETAGGQEQREAQILTHAQSRTTLTDWRAPYLQPLPVHIRPVKGPTRARECACVCLSRLHRVYRRLIAVLHLSAAAALWRNGRLIEPQIFSIIGSPGPWSADCRVGRRSRFATLTLSRQIEQHIPPHSSYKWMATYFVT